MSETSGNENNDPAIHSEILSGKRISFISGWQHKEGNQVFPATSAERLHSAARLEHAVYLRPQATGAITGANALLLDTVVDLDGHVDAVRIADYPGIHSLGPQGFSFEIWICPRYIRDPSADQNHPARPCVVFSKIAPDGQSGYFLLLNSDGRLDFVITARNEARTFSSLAGALTEGRFTHLAVTCAPANYISFIVDGVEIQRIAIQPPDSVTLPVNEGELILGAASVGTARHVSGLMTAFFVYSVARTSAQIASERFTRNRTGDSLVGAWWLTTSARLRATCYFITEDFMPEGAPAPVHRTLPTDPAFVPADVPLTPVTAGDQLWLFRQTVDNRIIVNAYRLDGAELLSANAAEASAQQLAGLTCYRGWFTAVAHSDGGGRMLFTVFNCGANGATAVTPDAISWTTFAATGTTLAPVSGDGMTGTISPMSASASGDVGINFATHPTAVYHDGHILLAVGTHEASRMLAVDFAVRTDGSLAAANGEARIARDGENALEGGATRHVYLRAREPVARPYVPPAATVTASDANRILLRLENSRSDALCMAQWNQAGRLVQSKFVQADTDTSATGLPQQYLWHLENLSKPGAAPSNGDAVALAGFVGGPTGGTFVRAQWSIRDQETCQWVGGLDEALRVNSKYQVFGIYALGNDASDESGKVEMREGAPLDDNHRVLLVPGTFHNEIAEAATSLAAIDRAPRGALPGTLNIHGGYGGLGGDGNAIVYLRRCEHPVAVYMNNADAWGSFLARGRDDMNGDYSRLPPYSFQKVCLEAMSEAPSVPPRRNNYDTPERSWYWFSFRLTTRFGGGMLTSGEEILLESPNPDYAPGGTPEISPWSAVVEDDHQGFRWQQDGKYNEISDQLKALERLKDWNYWVFKVGQVGPFGIRVVRGPILAGDPIILLPRTPMMESFVGSGSWPDPDQQSETISQIRQAINNRTPIEFVEPALDHPLPGVPSIINPAPGPQRTASMAEVRPGLSAVIIGLARTRAVAALDVDGDVVRLTFRGNGDALRLGNGLAHLNFGAGAEAANNDDFYVEGSYVQGHMTAGLFYQLEFLRSGTGPGIWSGLQRRLVSPSLEFPPAPPGFIWTAPPPYKMAGVCEAVGALDFGNQSGTPFVHSVIEAVLGHGTFGEGMFKPVLTIPVPEGPIKEIGDHVQARIVQEVNRVAPSPELPSRPKAEPGVMSWSLLADLLALETLAREVPNAGDVNWSAQIDSTLLRTKTRAVFNSSWMLDRVTDFHRELPVDPVRGIASAYASYGGVVELLASLLTSETFLDQLYRMESQDQTVIVRTQLHILTALDPHRSSNVGQHIAVGLAARFAHEFPEQILAKLDREEIATILEHVLAASVASPDLPQSQAINEALQMVFGLSSPISSVTGAAAEFRANNQPVRNHLLELADQYIAAGVADAAGVPMESLREVFASKRRLFETGIREKYPRLRTAARRISAGLCLVSSAGAIYSFWKINETWKNTPDEIMNVSTTVVGAIGSFTDSAEVVGHMLQLARNRFQPGTRATAVAAEAGEAAEIATVTRFAKFAKALKVMGPIADVLVIATSAYKFIEGGMSDYEQGMTGATLGLGVLGAGAGILLLLGSSAAAGPLSIFVLIAGIGLMVADKCKTDAEEREIRDKRAKVENWCRDLIDWHAVRAHA